MKYFKSIILIILSLIALSFLGSLLYYLEWINSSVYSYIELLVPIISLFLGGIYLGKNSTQKGWLEGLKLGSLIILVLFMIAYLGFNYALNFKSIIYYLIILVTHTFGSMMGIRNVENRK